ncbi:hypothetical protein KDK95_05585 [Actinospica sp. MGRD01-02]|uniref:PglY protein n=1 Tax=Actinospica acidithermotolerans TaxID=2828514 RepID=A0A941E620_9ACTN|nr:hypothetical protein [Actinospica acidithermotolerans]MBR7825771.1 hypothetical protein [Actinospica acidithermotolerans]
MGSKTLRDVLEIKDSVHAGDFKVELTGAIGDAAGMVNDYVVTDQLRDAFRQALDLIKVSVDRRASNAAYLHGSFGAGKSHFLAVLHAIVNNDPVARAKPGLQPVIADHDSWLRGRRFLMVPYHLVGSADITSALLGGYVKEVARVRPDAPTPAVYRDESLIADARKQREFFADDARFAAWLEGGRPAAAAASQSTVDDDSDLPRMNRPEEDAGADSVWTPAALDAAFAAPPGDPQRKKLVTALLDGPLSSYRTAMHGASGGFVSLEEGLSVISHHTKSLGYDGLILFLDELILWLQAHLTEKTFVNTQVQELVKLIESGNSDRPVPIVAFISRQRNLSTLIGEDIVGADVKNLEYQVNYLAERFDVINLEDRNLPAIIKERVLRRLPGADVELDAAFASVESANAQDRDTLLDAHGATRADWSDFRTVYPLTPALLNVLVALSGALQRERTGLKLVHELLRRNADMEVGRPIALGHLWDVLTERTGAAFTDHLKAQAEHAQTLHGRIRDTLKQRYGSETDVRFVQDDLLVKTLLLSALAPDVPALQRLTGPKLAALNYGALRSRVATAGATAVDRIKRLAGGYGEIRSDGDQANPVFTVHVSDLDVEPLLAACDDSDKPGTRRVWIKNVLWEALGVKEDSAAAPDERTLIWQGTKRTAEFVFANVRDPQAISRGQFEPFTEGNIKFVVDYPFDDHDHGPNDDWQRVRDLSRDGFQAPTVVWLPHFLSTSVTNDLGRLLRIQALLKGDRLDEVAATWSIDDRMRIRTQLRVNESSLTQQLVDALEQAYGIRNAEEANLGAQLNDRAHVYSLLPDHQLKPLRKSEGFQSAMLRLADDMLARMYPQHLNLDPAEKGDLVTLPQLKTVLGMVAAAVEDGSMRTVVESTKIPLAKRVVHGLQLGEVHDGPLIVTTDWRRRIDQQAAKNGVDASSDLKVEQIRRWIEEMGYTGLDRNAANMIIACYALVADKTWLYRQTPVAEPPELDQIKDGYALRTQELPDEQQFAAALAKAGALFGTKVAPVRNARNTTQLARAVRAQARAAQQAVNDLRGSLSAETHARLLGLTVDSARVVAVREAAELLARLARHENDTALVRELAAVQYSCTDSVISKTISTAKSVLDALDAQDRAEWKIVESVHDMAQRADDLGEQSRALIERLRLAAASDEFTRPLAEVLHEVGGRGLTLLSEAQRRAAVALPQAGGASADAAGYAPAAEVEAPPAGSRPTSAEQISLTEHGVPGDQPIPERPAPKAATRPTGRIVVAPSGVGAGSVESAWESAVGQLLEQARDYAAANPGVRIEVSWQPIDDTPDAATSGEGGQ